VKRYYPIVGALLGIIVVAMTGISLADQKAKDVPKKKAEPMKPIVVSGEWITADAKDRVFTNSYCKTYTLKMEKGKTYLLDLTSTVIQAGLRLEEAGGNQVAQDFDQFRNQGASIVYRPSKTDDFQIIATSAQPNAIGKFTLTVKELTGDEGKPIELQLAKGQVSITNALARTDQRYSGKICKQLTIKLEAGKTYQFDHKSRNFDAYLYLIGPDGNVLAQDDDSGGNLDSRIVHRATKTGEYRVIATSLGGQGIGPFTFIVQER